MGNQDINASIDKFLTANSWPYSFDKETGIFGFSLHVIRVHAKMDYEITAQEKGIAIRAFLKERANADDHEMIKKISECILDINQELDNGCFEINSFDGRISFYVLIAYGGDNKNEFPEDSVQNSICSITDICAGHYADRIGDEILLCLAHGVPEKYDQISEEEANKMLLEEVGAMFESLSMIKDMPSGTVM